MRNQRCYLGFYYSEKSLFFFFQAPVGGWFDSLVFQRAEMSVPDGAHLHQLDISRLAAAC